MPMTFQGTSSKPTTLANVADNKGLFSFPPPKPKSDGGPKQNNTEVAAGQTVGAGDTEATLIALDSHGTFEHNTGSRLKKRVNHEPVGAANDGEHSSTEKAAQKSQSMAVSVDSAGLAEQLAVLAGVVKDLQREQENLHQELQKRDEMIAERGVRLSELSSDLESLKQEVSELRGQATVKAEVVPEHHEEAAPVVSASAMDVSAQKQEAESLPLKPEEATNTAAESATMSVPAAVPMPPAPTEDESAAPMAMAAPALAPTPASVPAEEKKEAQPVQSVAGAAEKPSSSTTEALPELTMTDGLHKALYEFSKLYNRVEVKHRQDGGTLHPIEETLAKYHYQPRELAQVLYRNYLRTNDQEQAKLKVEEDVKQMVAAVTSLMPAEQVKEVQKEVAEKFAATPDSAKKGFLAKFKK